MKDNIKINNAILSRFDLIFLLLDTPDPMRDQKLSDHVMKVIINLFQQIRNETMLVYPISKTKTVYGLICRLKKYSCFFS